MARRPKRTALERFEALCCPEPNTGCWLWFGADAGSRKGYGEFWSGAKKVAAHRWAYEHFVGPIPDGLTIDHLCRTPSCVNPDHLEPVSLRENIRRGESISTRYARRDSCSKGHPLTEANVRLRKPGWRECRICCREIAIAAKRRYRKRVRERMGALTSGLRALAARVGKAS
jgi:hypothetical protein